MDEHAEKMLSMHEGVLPMLSLHACNSTYLPALLAVLVALLGLTPVNTAEGPV